MTYTPTHLKPWSLPGHYFGAKWLDYFVGLSRTRDSDPLEESNFHCFLAMIGGESLTVKSVRESHWACGWIEWIAIHKQDTKALELADELVGNLADYPILDEDDLFRRESELADYTWKHCYTWKERLTYMRDNRNQLDYNDFRAVLQAARGDFFPGYPADLIY